MAEQVVVGFAAALLVALADLMVTTLRADDAGREAAAWVLGGLHLVALELPLGVAAGAAAGLALVALRAAPWMAPLRRRISSWWGLWAHDPEGFASGAGLLAGAAIFLFGVRLAAEHFATRYHDPQLAAWAMGVASLGILLAAAIGTAVVAGVLRPVARRAGRAASTGVLLALALAGAVAVVAAVTAQAPSLFRAYDPLRLAWLPLAAAVYVLLAIALRRVLQRLAVRPARLRLAALACATIAASALAWSASTYGHRNVVRGVVERESVAGLRLVRAYMRATDRDGDGHSFAFGGGDCDDGNPNVHPGARDVPGDGIDADCFAGDGTPEVADFGDGAYGALPEGLHRPNLLLVTVDALRADHLGSYGYDRPTSPHMDAFAEDAVRFQYVVAQSSRSIRSVPSMMTGFYPSQIAYGSEYLFPSLRDENVTLAEALRDAGYRTAVTMGTDYFERVDHFFQGFDDVDQIDRYRPPRPTPVTRALRQLDRLEDQSQPWFLWVHLFNVHEEYLWDGKPSKFGDALIDEYDTEISLADAEVGRLLDALEARGLSEDTVVVLTSDHGEAFGEHGSYGHSTTLYEEALRVPLLVRGPGFARRTVPGTVALFDLMPTLLNMADVPVPRPMPARSLVPFLTGAREPNDDRLVVSEVLPDGLYPYDQKAIRRGAMKLIWWVREGTFQLYDLEEDPGETRDLSDAHRAEAEQLLGLLRAWVTQTNRPEQRHHEVVDRNRLDEPPRSMTRRLDARYPGFTLLGFDMPETSFEPGERIAMTFYYRVEAPIDDNLFFMVDIKGPQGYRVPPHFHAHHFPMNGRYRTYDWRTGEILRDPVEMIVPEDIRHPVTLRIDLAVLDGRRRWVPFEDAAGREGNVLDLAEVRIR
ncbi:MAG: sulfatase-like hydrolase/transferase [Myxococcota bacterium]